jgi:hypothetical protein
MQEQSDLINEKWINFTQKMPPELILAIQNLELANTGQEVSEENRISIQQLLEKVVDSREGASLVEKLYMSRIWFAPSGPISDPQIKLQTGITAGTIEDIIKINDLLEDLSNEENILAKFNDRDPSLKVPISVAEFGVLQRLASLNSVLLKYDQLGLISGNEKLSDIFKKSSQSLSLLENFHNCMELSGSLSTRTLADTYSIDSETINAMQLLGAKASAKQITLAGSQISSIQGMLASAIGSMTLNKKITELGSEKSSVTGIDASTISDIKAITFRTRHLDKIKYSLNEIHGEFKKVISGEIPELTHKITLEQYGILHDLAALNKVLENYHSLGLINGNTELTKLYEQTKQAKSIVSHLDTTFDQEFKMPLGTVLLTDMKKGALLQAKELSYIDKVKTFVSKYGHASIGVTAQAADVENKQSHINPDYKTEKFALRNFLYSDAYRLNIENLISKEMKVLIKQNYGPNWLSILESKYSEIEREIHDHHLQQGLHAVNLGDEKLKSFSIATSFFHGGHKGFIKHDHKNADIRDEIFGRGKWQEYAQEAPPHLLCSEFVGKTLIAAVQELNDRVSADLIANGIVVPKKLIESPISQREKLDILSPERLLAALQERNAVTKVESPVTVGKFFSQNEKPTAAAPASAAVKKALSDMKKEAENPAVVNEQKGDDDTPELNKLLVG